MGRWPRNNTSLITGGSRARYIIIEPCAGLGTEKFELPFLHGGIVRPIPEDNRSEKRVS